MPSNFECERVEEMEEKMKEGRCKKGHIVQKESCPKLKERF